MFLKIFSFFRILQSSVIIASAIQSYKEVDIYFIASEEAVNGWENEICRNPLPILLCATETETINFQCAYSGSLSKTFLGRNNDTKFSRFSDSLGRLEHGSMTKGMIGKGDCFYCWAEDSPLKRSIAYTIRLEDNCPPAKVELKQVVHAGTSATLDCWGGKIDERHTVDWYFRSFQLPINFIPVSPTWGFQVEFGKGNTSAKLSNLSDVYSGTYQCIIRFLESNLRFQRQFDLWVLGKPLKPTNPRVLTISDTEVTLEWRPMHPDSNHKGTFAVKYIEAIQAKDINKTQPIIQNGPKITLSGLKPFTQYLVEIKETNDFGESQPASAMFLTRNSSIATLGYDLNILATAEKEVTLKCPFQNGSARIRGWDLFRKNASDWDQLSTDSSSTYLIRRFSLADTGQYKCALPNQNSEIIARLVMVETPNQPESLTCRRGTDGKLVVSWSVTEAMEKIEGITTDIENFRFKFKNVGGGGGWTHKIVSGDRREVVVDGEDGNGLYMMELSALNMAGERSTGMVFCHV